MDFVKKQQWTEAEVIALPDGEHDYFDRKSGQMLSDHDFGKDLAKALCAFANSGGGHFILGVADDGTFDGVPPIAPSPKGKSRQSIREWLEQKISHLLNYPLQDFRVHVVEPDSDTAIPKDRVVIVIDVGDSSLAPHQTADKNAPGYYFRQGGHSKLANHFYLEMLRNRLTGPALSARLVSVKPGKAFVGRGGPMDMDGVFCEVLMEFEIMNIGRTAAYKWFLAVSLKPPDGVIIESDLSKFPVRTSLNDNTRIDSTLLPSLSIVEKRQFGLWLPWVIRPDALEEELRKAITPEFVITLRTITETSPGEAIEILLAEHIDFKKSVIEFFAPIREDIERRAPGTFERD